MALALVTLLEVRAHGVLMTVVEVGELALVRH